MFSRVTRSNLPTESSSAGRLVAAASALVLASIIASAGCAAHRPSASAGQPSKVPASNDWLAVTRLAEGASVHVDLQDGTSAAGRFVAADDSQVSVRLGGTEQTLPRPTVHRLATVHRNTKRKATRGLIIGGVAGGLLGALTAETNRAEWALFMAGGWAAIGAAIGASDGFADREVIVVYETERLDAASHKSTGLANLQMEPTRQAVPFIPKLRRAAHLAR
jgi:hypothetical protein